MSPFQKIIIAVLGSITAAWVLWAFAWLASQLRSSSPPRSFGELKSRSEKYSVWYLSPLSTRAVRIWKYLSWIAAAAWLIAGYMARMNMVR